MILLTTLLGVLSFIDFNISIEETDHMFLLVCRLSDKRESQYSFQASVAPSRCLPTLSIPSLGLTIYTFTCVACRVLVLDY